MNNRRVIVAVVTVIAVSAAILVSQQRAPQTSRETQTLFPELAARVNDISELVVRDAENALTVRRGADSWGIVEADEYPALTDKVKQTALAVSDLQVIAEKTDNPELYERLGVEDPDSKGATSHLLTLNGNGEQLAQLIVGKSRRSKSAAAAPGLYVRIPEQAPTLLVQGRLSVSADLAQWIKRDIINIEGDRVRAIHLRPAQGTEAVLKREQSADELTLQDIPEGKEQASGYLSSRMATVLENVYVDGVRKQENIDYSSPDAVLSVTTFDGLTAHIEVVSSGEHSYARFSFAVDASHATGEPAMYETATGIDTAEEDATETEAETEADEQTGLTPEQEAEALNALVQGWAYQLSSSKAELYGQTLSDLVRDPASEDAEAAE